jgi:hypothetical protein
MKRLLLAAALLCLCGAALAETPPTEEMANLAALGGPTHEAQARELILRAGYAEVEDLKRGPDGTWQARALREERSVKVKVDKQGNVSP